MCRRASRFNPIVTYDEQRAALNIATPAIASNRLRPHSPQAVKRRLTLFWQPNHGFGESFREGDPHHPHDFWLHTLRWNRPNDSPNPSINASVPSISAILALTSRSHAKLASLASSPRASSASFNSLSKECHWRCKETSWCPVERTSSWAAPACAPHTAEVVMARSTL